MRDSSNRIVRMYWARGGASISISFSAARMNGTSLAKLPSQSMRLIERGDLRDRCGPRSASRSRGACSRTTGSAQTTCSPSRRAMIRSVPWVAGCCGPMLRVMPSVSSSTLSRASAACAAMYAQLLRGSASARHADASTVASASAVRRRSSSRRASAPRRRCPATASPCGPAAGSPCAAGWPSKPTAGRCGARSGWPDEGDAEHLPRLPLVPVGAGVDGRPVSTARCRRGRRPSG